MVLHLNAQFGLWHARFFNADEDAVPGRNPVIVISQALWRAQFGQSPNAVGRTVELNGQAYTIIGIAPGGFHGTAMPSRSDVWVPLMMISPASWLESRSTAWLAMTGRSKPGLSREQAEAALSVLASQIKTAHPQDFIYTRFKCLRVGISFMTATPGAVRLVLMLAAGALLFLFVACTNVMGMLLARATTRMREMAIRASIGAARKRLLRLLLTESVATFALAGALAVLLVYWSRPALESMLAITPYFMENQGNLLDLVRLSFYPQRRLMGAAGAVSALALVIAAVGLYAALLFLVSQHRREIGVRMALGADGAQVFHWALIQGIKLALAGSIAGLVLALCGARLVQSFLFGVSAWNPTVFLLTAGTLFVVAILACWWPAVRASRVDPMEALRCE